MFQVNWDKLTTFHFDYKELAGIFADSATTKFPEQRARAFLADHWYFAVQCSIVYFFLIFGIKFIMKNRQPFDLQRPLNAWNLFLAVFSTAGAIFMSADFFGIIYKKGIRGSYCELDGMTEGVNGFWMFIFMLSKLLEFTDTIFIVLRKKPLMFLHWYHHILTLLYGFYSFPVSPGFNRWGVYLNFVVHSFMYSYYFLRSIRVPIPGFVAKGITSGQIIQFVLSIGVLVCVGVEHYILKSFNDCVLDIPTFWIASFMDMTYLILFINFFLQAYVFKGGKDKYKKIATKEKKSQ
ncbi:hypothetical protein PFISCL1PPCAC_14840 [Pristionchus fissidentatus]|uniref:Elongation of very long chain fatty acids protein n=1 Tax=Pristionchus fissidentatus TaxID=1538716 RepID=A0AAV5VYU2_9BILA|nr:hypothetical protein PFISCL1PPCAC_14840 [Pristionchus fissidentatus]